MLEPGNPFPAFSLPDQNNQPKSFADLADGKGLIFYIYPKDDTPGCTNEAKDFRDRLQDFAELGYRIVGISKDSAASHCKFIDKYELNFPLLSDSEGDFLTEIGAWGEKKMYGRTSVGIIRSTFVIDAEGEVVKAYRNVRAKGHAERVLKELTALAG